MLSGVLSLLLSSVPDQAEYTCPNCSLFCRMHMRSLKVRVWQSNLDYKYLCKLSVRIIHAVVDHNIIDKKTSVGNASLICSTRHSIDLYKLESRIWTAIPWSLKRERSPMFMITSYFINNHIYILWDLYTYVNIYALELFTLLFMFSIMYCIHISSCVHPFVFNIPFTHLGPVLFWCSQKLLHSL